MRLTVGSAKDLESAAPLLALLVPQARLSGLPGGELGARALGLTGGKVFKGESGQTLLLHAESAKGPRALLLIGTGTGKSITGQTARQAGVTAVNQAARLGAKRFVLGAAGGLTLEAAQVGALAEGVVMGSYRYPLKKPEHAPPTSCTLVVEARGAAAAVKVGVAVAEGVNLARELGDLPGNVCTPTYLRDTAESISKAGRFGFKAHDKRALKRMKMGGILAVNQGSATEPYILEMDYKPAGYKKTVCVVGKGLTFDSGGISIKPAAGMEEMKYDMCGSAAVLGLMKVLAATRPKGTRVIGIVGTTDNMSGPDAYKPGDVITTGSGKTIEVINTDAEGRVVLSDAIFQATKYEPDAIVDLATLTGAIVVALGHEAAGLFCRDDKLRARMLAAGEAGDEQIWAMPTYDAYSEMVKSKWADVRNSAGREAGSCTAAAFLFEFSNGIPHAHIDVAGAAWEMKPRHGLPAGARGYGVRLLHEAVQAW